MVEYGSEAEKRGESLMCGFGWRSLKRLSGVCFVDQSGQMSSSKRICGCKVNPDGDVPDKNNKAEADPPTVTANPLQMECNLNLFHYPIKSEFCMHDTPAAILQCRAHLPKTETDNGASKPESYLLFLVTVFLDLLKEHKHKKSLIIRNRLFKVWWSFRLEFLK
ncbi:hypothetical protein T10_1382 [Trichinella papuae]|uniref:Uncharacterized protein n=1 Tax=Trichinella papuae TaxID=268474 RepID=A0A0V1M1E5_9BILA|nr:hypothetical protein T10_12608 [Trichinella papuae]KRZ70133.1 hypothetical protein T10_1382 [Trichinella papuae]